MHALAGELGSEELQDGYWHLESRVVTSRFISLEHLVVLRTLWNLLHTIATNHYVLDRPSMPPILYHTIHTIHG